MVDGKRGGREGQRAEGRGQREGGGDVAADEARMVALNVGGALRAAMVAKSPRRSASHIEEGMGIAAGDCASHIEEEIDIGSCCEVIVVDDCSTDDTVEVVNRWLMVHGCMGKENSEFRSQEDRGQRAEGEGVDIECRRGTPCRDKFGRQLGKGKDRRDGARLPHWGGRIFKMKSLTLGRCGER
jgi:hypothetical protein